MGKDRFDFSEIDAALPAAERMQEEDRVADALENNYKAVRILGANVEKLENRLSEELFKQTDYYPCRNNKQNYRTVLN